MSSTVELRFEPTEDQAIALKQITENFSKPGYHLLTGYAGSGKTTLMMEVVRTAKEERLSIYLTAPTHKAVQVLRDKAASSGLNVECHTIHALLGLVPHHKEKKTYFTKSYDSKPVRADIVVIDECSMVDRLLYAEITRHLQGSFVLFVGDPAQLPPVNEKESLTFQTLAKSHLNTIVRQKSDNPILDVADAIRAGQGTYEQWTWCRPSNREKTGVFISGNVDDWLKKAFTSDTFEQNPDSFRYLAWTNKRVKEINNKIRKFRYGNDLPYPFMPEEKAMFRAPFRISDFDGFHTNEEVTVIGMIEGTEYYTFWDIKHEGKTLIKEWAVSLPVWLVDVRREDDIRYRVKIPRDEKMYDRLLRQLADEAQAEKEVTGVGTRWRDYHHSVASLAKLQSIYALTVHCSQGSTFTNVFMDIGDIRQNMGKNPLECQQMLYVAATRPTNTLTLVGV